MLSQNEQRVLDLLIEDPFLSQQAIAEQLDLNRSTVATIISSLTEKKKLLGKAYIVNQETDVICIGGINIDRKYVLTEDFLPKTSNPVMSSISVGGVARNIAENLGRMNINVSLLSVAGLDQDYEYIKQETETYVNMHHVTVFPNESTSAYSAVLDPFGDMQFALADMSLSAKMDHQWINDHRNVIIQAKLIVIDLNVSRDVVQEVIQIAQVNRIPLVIIPVSGPKMKNLPDNLEGVSWLIINQDESEAYHQYPVKKDEDIAILAKAWLDKGIDQVLITRGSKATYYAHRNGHQLEIQPPVSQDVVDVTGAGDSNAAGIIYGILKGYSPQGSIELGMTNAYYTVQSQDTVRHNLNEQDLLIENKDLHKKGN